jgi:hypothetical protein
MIAIRTTRPELLSRISGDRRETSSFSRELALPLPVKENMLLSKVARP